MCGWETQGSGRGRIPGAALGHCSAVSPLGPSALQRSPVPARQQPPRGSLPPAPSPAWRTRTAWERRSAARWAAALPAWSRRRVRTRGAGWMSWFTSGTLCAMAVSLTPWSLGQHTVLSLPRQLPTAAGKTQRRDVAAGTRNVRVMAGTRDPRGRQGGHRGVLNCHIPSALPDQPKPSEVSAVQPGSFRERCRGDSDCPDAQKCCNSSCGQQCPPGVPAGEAGRDSMGQHGTEWDSMGGEGGDTAQRPGMTPWGSSHHGTELWHKRDPSAHACQGGLCQVWGGDTLHSPQVGPGVGREGDSATNLW